MAHSTIELAAAVDASILPRALVPKFYTLNDLMGDLANLQHLLDEAAHHLGEQDYGPEEDRNHELDRINSLVWMSRDMVERLNALTDVYYEQIGSTASGRGVAK